MLANSLNFKVTITMMKNYNILLNFPVSLTAKRNLSLLHTSSLTPLNPWFITGFADAESSFRLNIYKSKNVKIGWSVIPTFSIELHGKDKLLLESIKSYFSSGFAGNKVGGISINKRDGQLVYSVNSIKELAIIVKHFDKYPLITQKRADFQLFKSAVELMSRKEHLKPEGLRKIVSLRASINEGLTPILKESFADITPVLRPVVEDQEVKDLNWLSGFVTGDGCFLINIFKSSAMKSGFQVKLAFSISQHSRDEQLMRSLKEYLDCGNYQPHSSLDVGNFFVTGFSDIADKIIPLFKKYKIEGVKALDFADFCKVAQLMKNKDHLNQEGLEQIQKIKAGMNRGR